jgi:hypothetical protein
MRMRISFSLRLIFLMMLSSPMISEGKRTNWRVTKRLKQGGGSWGRLEREEQPNRTVRQFEAAASR